MASRCHVCRELGIPRLNPSSQTEHQRHGFTTATLRIILTYSIVSFPKPSPGEPPGTWGHVTNLSCLVSPTCGHSCSRRQPCRFTPSDTLSSLPPPSRTLLLLLRPVLILPLFILPSISGNSVPAKPPILHATYASHGKGESGDSALFPSPNP